MISLAGATMVTGRFEECRSILRTFAKYVKNGLLPNLFPEGGETPRYNSFDAPLLFVNAVYEYMQYSGDTAFRDEILPVLTQIIDAYRNGTDFHIRMDSDSLVMGETVWNSSHGWMCAWANSCQRQGMESRWRSTRIGTVR